VRALHQRRDIRLRPEELALRAIGVLVVVDDDRCIDGAMEIRRDVRISRLIAVKVSISAWCRSDGKVKILIPVAILLPRAMGVTGMKVPSKGEFIRQYRGFPVPQATAFTLC
jgi:hypothetical protein